jgi:NAD(P)-dependent dehydrogenase (short-subunit alcohol dehydrogenase family)
MGILDSGVALVTEASKGIGAGIAKGLAAAGASALLDGFDLLSSAWSHSDGGAAAHCAEPVRRSDAPSGTTHKIACCLSLRLPSPSHLSCSLQ